MNNTAEFRLPCHLSELPESIRGFGTESSNASECIFPSNPAICYVSDRVGVWAIDDILSRILRFCMFALGFRHSCRTFTTVNCVAWCWLLCRKLRPKTYLCLIGAQTMIVFIWGNKIHHHHVLCVCVSLFLKFDSLEEATCTIDWLPFFCSHEAVANG